MNCSIRCICSPGAIDSRGPVIFKGESKQAFGACEYVSWKLSNDKFESRFQTAKGRAVPLMTLGCKTKVPQR